MAAAAAMFAASALLLPFVILTWNSVSAQLDCDILDPACRIRYRQNVEAVRPTLNTQSRCNYQDIWLIPGRADASCSNFLSFFVFFLFLL